MSLKTPKSFFLLALHMRFLQNAALFPSILVILYISKVCGTWWYIGRVDAFRPEGSSSPRSCLYRVNSDTVSVGNASEKRYRNGQIQFAGERGTFRLSSHLLGMKSPLKAFSFAFMLYLNPLNYHTSLLSDISKTNRFIVYDLYRFFTPSVPSQTNLDVTCSLTTCIRLLRPKISIFCTLMRIYTFILNL